MDLAFPPTGGSGVNVGQQPGSTTFDQQNASNEANKSMLGITRNPDDLVFTQMNPRYMATYLSGGGYQASPDQALLDHPLENVRVATSSAKNDSSWEENYKKLLTNLPAGLVKRLADQEALPLEQRNSSFVAFDIILETTAKAISTLQSLSEPVPVESVAEERIQDNFVYPQMALKNSISNAQELGLAVTDFISQEGANYRNFDGLNNLMGQMQLSLNFMQQVSTALGTPNGISTNDKTTISESTRQLLNSAAQFDHTLVGNDMQIVQSNLQALAKVLSPFSLPNVGSAPLALGLAIALIGIDGSNTEASLIDATTSSGIKTLCQTILESNGAKLGLASREFLTSLTTVGLLLFTGLASQAVSPGFGLLPPQAKNEENATRYFAFTAALPLIISSNIVGTFYQEAISAAGGDDKTQAIGTPILTQLTHLMIILAGTRQEGKQSTDALVDDHQRYLDQGLNATEQLNTKAALSADVLVAVKQMQAALSDSNFGGVIESFSKIFASEDGSTDSWFKNFDASRQITGHITQIGASSASDHQLTRMMTAG